jgi:predicted HD phosphohydrolase
VGPRPVALSGPPASAELRGVLVSLEGVVDGDERVDELAHALQCASLAMAAGAGPELVAAALFHDVGRAQAVQEAFPGLPHETAGARWVLPRTSEKVAWLVRAHVPAKLYLVESEPSYLAGLSSESLSSLRLQRRFGYSCYIDELVVHRWWPEAVLLRRWDDLAKVPGAATRELGTVLAEVERMFDR